MDNKGGNAYKISDEGNGQVPASVGFRSRQTFTGREKLLLFFSVFLALCTLTLIIGLVIKLETDPALCKPESTTAVSHVDEVHGKKPESTTAVSHVDEVHGKNPACLTRDCVSQAAALINAIDFDVDPCENFYEFACGKWMRSKIIPEDKSAYERFTEVRDRVQHKLKVQLEKPINASDIPAVKKVKTMYASCINEDLISSLGIGVTDGLLQELGGWPVTIVNWDESNFNLEDMLVKLGHYNNKILLEASVYPDDKDSSVYIIVIDQSNLGMPSRSYYLEPRNDSRIQVYEKMALEIAVKFGANKASAMTQIKDMVDFEISVAKLMLAQSERRDMDKLYHKMTVAELQVQIKDFRWLHYLQGLASPFNLTITDQENVVVYTPTYLNNVLQIVAKTPKRTLANYLIWRIMMNRVSNLGEDVRDIKREYNKVVFGTKREASKWKSCIDYVNNNLGDAVGRIFVDDYFDVKAKENAVEMIRYLRESFENLIKKATWMDEETTKYALKKAAAIYEKIGYPESLLNNTHLNEEFNDVDFKDDKYFENVLTLLRDRVRDNFFFLRKKVDRTEWTTTSAIVNAFYSPNLNSITFPAAILQPPFYSKEYPMSLVFGGIGMVIGHEITHGFDDEGRQYNMIGNFYQWWSNASLTNFKDLAKCIIDQYSVFEINGDHVNGEMTLGENMADNGGIKASFEAYQKWVSENGEEAPLPGLDLSHEQLFFVNFAQGWCALSTDAGLHNQMLTDSHSPSRFRVIGTVSNSENFSKAYKCSTHSRMNPPKKCGVW